MVKQITPGAVLLIGVLSLATGWLVGTSTSPNQNPQDGATARPRTGPRPLGTPANTAPLTRQLRERMDTQPARTPSTGRNPFVFEARRPAAVGRYRPEPVAETVAPPPAPMPEPLPLFKLSGIAANLDGAAMVLTAIVNDNGSLAFVKAGDKLSNGFSVVRVEETGVVIIDAAGVTQTLRLP